MFPNPEYNIGSGHFYLLKSLFSNCIPSNFRKGRASRVAGFNQQGRSLQRVQVQCLPMTSSSPIISVNLLNRICTWDNKRTSIEVRYIYVVIVHGMY